MKFFTICLCMFFLFSCNKATEVATTKQKPAEEQAGGTNYNKEMDEIRKNLKSETKIKLKKDAKGGYSWEIAGKNAQEILKANDTLRKRLND